MSNAFNWQRISVVGLILGACLLNLGGPLLAQIDQEQLVDQYSQVRNEMVKRAIEAAGVKDPRVLNAMRSTLRHEFVPEHLRSDAYIDGALPIGEEQTISSPFIVAYMTECLEPKPTDKVLEIGTGSGYQAAVLSPLVAEVYTIEIVEDLGKRATRDLARLGYENVFVKIGDGFKGWPEHAPFDKIIVTCSPEKVPQPLIDQLADDGMIVVPVGQRHQQSLMLLRKVDGKMVEHDLRPTFFVPMTGRAEDEREIMPDPANPQIVNGDFELGLDDNKFVRGWYYERLLQFQEPDEKTGESRHVKFVNDVSGQDAHLMQGIGLDGREVSRVDFKGRVRYEDIVAGQSEWDQAFLALTFYDAQRHEVGRHFFGPFKGTRAQWKSLSKRIRVPVSTREAMVRIGLFGATGTIWFDDITLTAVK